MSTSITLRVPSMACGHCEKTIRKALREIGMTQAEIDLKAKTIEVGARPEALAQVLVALAEVGYGASAI